jgi:hypothetical protein
MSDSVDQESTPWITLSMLKGWLSITDTSQDANLTPLITAATQACVSFISRDLVLVTTTETYDGTGSTILPLNVFPVISVSAVSMDGCPILPAGFNQAGYTVGKFSLLAKSMCWSKGVQNITVSYTAGYPSVPTDAVQACLLTASAMFNSMASDPNLQSESTAGVFSGTFWAGGAGAVPPAARSLLSTYRQAYRGIVG